jgi:hypothetical protein
MLISKCVPGSLNSSYQNLLVNVGSRFETMEVGIPCNLKIRSMKVWETKEEVKG